MYNALRATFVPRHLVHLERRPLQFQAQLGHLREKYLLILGLSAQHQRFLLLLLGVLLDGSLALVGEQARQTMVQNH